MASGARTGVHVVIPYRDGCPYREAARGWVLGRWAALGLSIRLGLHTAGPWCKASAIRNGIRDTTADVLVIADADVWCDGIAEAIELVEAGAPWVIPHDRLHRLSQSATAAVLAGKRPHERMPLAEGTRPYSGRPGGGLVVIRREVYDDCPLDPRFKGWGQEDEAWALALTCLHGRPVRLGHRLWHLWHPPQERQNRGIGNEQSFALYKRYSRAARNPDAMRALIREAR